MSERKERVTGVGYAGVLKGIWKFGMCPRPKGTKLLLEREEEEQQLLLELGNVHYSCVQHTLCGCQRSYL